jgi:hypothetical protein
MLNLKCLVLRHKWKAAEATNEPGLRLACARCGKVRSVAPIPSDGGLKNQEIGGL